MNWDYIAGFFDGEGNLHIQKVKKNSRTFSILIRMYSERTNVLTKIQEFMGFGKIYLKKASGVSELTFMKKEDVKNFLEKIKDKVILKKGQVDYLLENYSFQKGFSNSNFDIDKFRSFISRKNVDKFRKLSTINKNEIQKIFEDEN